MQRTITLPNVGTGAVYNRTNNNGHKRRDKTDTKNYGSFRCRNDFLNVNINPVNTYILNREYKGEDYNLLTQENYEYLRDSAAKYVSLSGGKLEYKLKPTAHAGICIAGLYKEFARILGKEIGFNIENRDNMLYFNLWKTHGWGDHTLYWFPVKFLESLDVKLRRICVTFLHELIHSNNMSVLNNEEDTEIILDWMECTIDEVRDTEKEEVKAVIEAYRENGKAYALLEEVYRRSYYKNLRPALQRYAPADDSEKELVALMREGLDFIGKDKSAINNYVYDPYFDEDADCFPVALGQQIRLIYDENDRLSEAMTDYLNTNLRESYELIPITTLELSPQTESLFSMDDYPERFFKWSDKFISLITTISNEQINRGN